MDLPLWNPDEDDVLVCRAVRQETHDVRTFVFAGRRPCRFAFRPGQFLTFDVPVDGRVVNRCYTISSSAARPYTVAITTKRVPGGGVSNWMHDNLRPGDEIRATGPMGDFTPDLTRPTKYLFLSGGSGITPLMSMLRTFDDLAEERDVTFVHAARTPADIIFRDELDLIARRARSVRLAHVCEATGGEPGWPGFTGRLTLPMLRLVAPDLAEREVYVCGPGPFMAAVRGMLAEAGFDMSRHREESFNFEELTGSGAVVEPPAALGAFRVDFAKSGKVVECAPEVTVLKAGHAAGLRLPSSCTKGLCGTCKTKLVSGTVEMRHAGGIRQREIDQGMILLCCSRPTSDLVVER